MKKPSIKPQSDVERERDVGLEVGGGVSGIESVGSEFAVEVSQKLKSMGEDVEKEGEFCQTRKRAYYDKDGHLLRRQGHRFRADHLKTYKIHAALKGMSQQELINIALEYYKENVLQKSQSQRLKEAGVGELGI
jgi:hypothetical protein